MDETLYLRGRHAVRGEKNERFMRDGFDRWAESEAPAREGQVEKIPAPTTNSMSGGAIDYSALASHGHHFLKKHGSKVKHLARTYGGEYGAHGANVLGALGYGHPVGHAVGGASYGQALSHGHHFLKKHGSKVKHLARTYGGEYGAQGAELLGHLGYGRAAPRAKRAPSARNMIVKKVMAERGCSLAEASRAVKSEGLY